LKLFHPFFEVQRISAGYEKTLAGIPLEKEISASFVTANKPITGGLDQDLVYDIHVASSLLWQNA
jgi:hypothetical protein